MSISARVLVGVLLVAGCTSGTAPPSSAPSVSARQNPPAHSSAPRSSAPSSAPAGSSAPTSAPTRTSAPATSAPAASAPLSSVPAASDLVQVYADCRTPTVRPASIVLTCTDGGVAITGITWTAWGELSATGSGTLRYNDCKPNCAQGTSHAVRGTVVTLSRPVDLGDGLVVWTRITERPAPPGFPATQTLPTRPV